MRGCQDKELKGGQNDNDNDNKQQDDEKEESQQRKNAYEDNEKSTRC